MLELFRTQGLVRLAFPFDVVSLAALGAPVSSPPLPLFNPQTHVCWIFYARRLEACTAAERAAVDLKIFISRESNRC
jgi:hypothetical protein